MITINNYKELGELSKGLDEPKSLSDLVKRQAIAESFKDGGLDGFKEIDNINNISFGHFIVLEKMLELDLEMEEKIKMVSPILIRPLTEKQLDNENIKLEEIHKNKVWNIQIGSVYSAFNRYLELRHEYLYKTYNGVIYGTLDESEEEEEEEGTNVNSSQSAREFHTKKFFWQSMISTVANGDIFKFNKVVDLMMHTVMPYLAEQRSLQIVENLEHKANIS